MQNIDQAKKLFNQLASGLTRRADFAVYPNSVFFFKGDEMFFEYNINSGWLWCSDNKVWSFFWPQAGVRYNSVQVFIKNQVEEHFKLMAVTPHGSHRRHRLGVEEHFKLMAVTPMLFQGSALFEVEEHFKLMDIEK